jgi:hypothetical protein
VKAIVEVPEGKMQKEKDRRSGSDNRGRILFGSHPLYLFGHHIIAIPVFFERRNRIAPQGPDRHFARHQSAVDR